LLLTCQTATNGSPGAIRLRSSASLLTTACPARSAQTTTWASTMSAVPVLANKRPTAVASGPSSAMRSVPACRISRQRRACLAGFRMACASAVAGIVIRMPRSVARARSASARRSFQSSAISPPASKVMPLTQPSLDSNPFSVRREKELHRPTRVPSSSAGHPSVVAHPVAFPSNRRHRREQLQPHASRRQRRFLPVRLRQVREWLPPDRLEA
jgi:hypothetical protein